MPEIQTDLLRWVVLTPLLGVVLNIGAALTDRAKLARLIGPGCVIATFGLALAAVVQLTAQPAGAALVDDVYHWIKAGPLAVDLTFRVDALTAMMLLIITGIGSLIHIYALGYMDHDPDVARFFAYMNLFVASMLVLVLADSLVLLFVGWEGVGACSYLLVGFWYSDRANADAGQKAMIANRVGDAAFLIGMFILFWGMNALHLPSLKLSAINAVAPLLANAMPWLPTAVCLLLLVGATGKSAQIPLFVWLPDAMAGPTPVSALIQAATMVTAGVYMIARLSVLYAQAPMAMEVVALVGASTCLFAATIALVQDDLKKVLAYSTVSQIGYMVLVVGVGAFSAGLFNLLTHAFFKALLFLSAGAVMHAMHGEIRMSKLGGLAAKMPITSKVFLIGSCAIAGVPGFSGFFSKDMVLEAAFVGGHRVAWLLGLLGVACTGFYIFRGYFLTFHTEVRAEPEKMAHVHEMSPVMTVPLMILALGAATIGWLGLPGGFLWGNVLGEWLAPVLARAPGHHAHASASTLLGLMGLATSMCIAGITLAWVFYMRSPALPVRLAARAGAAYRMLLNKYWIDEIYDALFVRSYAAWSRFAWRAVDTTIVDGLVNGVGESVVLSAGLWRRLQSGDLQHYALATLAGAVALVGGAWAFAAGF